MNVLENLSILLLHRIFSKYKCVFVFKSFAVIVAMILFFNIFCFIYDNPTFSGTVLVLIPC